MIYISILFIVILFSTLVDCRLDQPSRLLSFGILRMLIVMPLLAIVYLSICFDKKFYFIPVLYAAENVFALFWMMLAYRLYQVKNGNKNNSILLEVLFLLLAAGILASAFHAHLNLFSGASITDDVLIISHYSLIYYSALLMLISSMLMAWQIEAFWRSLDTGDKWRHKYLLIGQLLVCVILGWSASYRLTYLRLPREHLLLLAIILLLGFAFMAYALAKHRLLNRKLFISRKVVYATVTPMVFVGFLFFVGIAALLFRFFGWSVSYVLQWTFVIAGITGICVLGLSSSIRRRVRYFISTHFYVNKYEYRDEWLAFFQSIAGSTLRKGSRRRLVSDFERLFIYRKDIDLAGRYEKWLSINEIRRKPCP